MNRNHLTLRTWVLLVVMMWSAMASRAATFRELTFDEMTTRAEQIFFGTVTTATSLKIGSGEIVTDFGFTDVELIKGNLLWSTTDIRMLGGTVGEITMSIAGAPTFAIGKRYVVFIAKNGRVMFPTLGGPQGIFEARTDKVTGEVTIYDYGGRPLTAIASESDTPRSAPRELDASGLPQKPAAMTKGALVNEIQKRLGQ